MTRERFSQNSENREKPLAGKVALITGSGRDIGAGIAKAFAEEGVNIILNYRHRGKNELETEAAIRVTGVKVEIVEADITDSNNRLRFPKVIDTVFGRKLDIIVFNASGVGEDINVAASTDLLGRLLPRMNEGGLVIQMQSVPGHFEPQLRGLGLMTEEYKRVAPAKYKGEQSLRARIKDMEVAGVKYLVVCPTVVPDTSNIRMFDWYQKRRSLPTATEIHAELSDQLGLLREVSIAEVAAKVVELSKRTDLPQGYVELFGGLEDARFLLSRWYSDEKTFVDVIDFGKKVARMIVAKSYCEGHFRKEVGVEVLPGYIIEEGASQVALLFLERESGEKDLVPLLVHRQIDLKNPASPGDIINYELVDMGKSGKEFSAQILVTNSKSQKLATVSVAGLVGPKRVMQRMLRH